MLIDKIGLKTPITNIILKLKDVNTSVFIRLIFVCGASEVQNEVIYSVTEGAKA